MPEITAEEELDLRFLSAVRGLPGGGKAGQADRAAPIAARSALTGGQAIALFDAQAGSRHLDLAARYLRAEGHGFYTIGSAGHEANAAVAAAVRPSDPAPLPLRRLLPRPRRPGTRLRAAQGRPARAGRRPRRADSRWPSQGLR